MADVWAGFLDHLGAVTGRRVTFLPFVTARAQIAAMQQGKLHVAGVGTGATVDAMRCANYVPFATLADRVTGGIAGYRMQIIVRADSTITDLQDLRGKMIAFTVPTSLSGYRLPVDMLRREQMVPRLDYWQVFTRRHEVSIQSVLDGENDAAAIADDVLRRMLVQGRVKAGELRVIFQSALLPSASYGYYARLGEPLVERIKRAFFDFPWEGSSLAREFPARRGFVAVTAADWAPVQAIVGDQTCD